MKVKLKKYRFDVSEPEQARKYAAICEEAKALGHKLFSSWGKHGWVESLPEEATIETELLFSNQYNTAEGFRLFDWSESIYPNKTIKSGYFITGDLEQLRKAKDNQHICGYCGKRYTKAEAAALSYCCNSCLGSEYLEEENLPLLQLVPVSKEWPRAGARDAESLPADIRERFLEAQEKARHIRKLKKAERLKAEADKLLEKTEEENQENTYKNKVKAEIMRAGFDPKNLIFYGGNSGWVYGWRSPCSREEQSEFLEALDKAGEHLPLDPNGIPFSGLLSFKNKD